MHPNDPLAVKPLRGERQRQVDPDYDVEEDQEESGSDQDGGSPQFIDPLDNPLAELTPAAGRQATKAAQQAATQQAVAAAAAARPGRHGRTRKVSAKAQANLQSL